MAKYSLGTIPRLASVGADDQVKLWDTRRFGQPQAPRILPGQGGPIADLIAFSPDGSRLAVATDDDTATIYDLGAGDRSLRCCQRGHGPIALAFSPNGRWLASGGYDCAVKVWDAETSQTLHTFRGHLLPVTTLRFMVSPRGLRLVSGSLDGTVKVWDLAPLERQFNAR